MRKRRSRNRFTVTIAVNWFILSMGLWRKTCALVSSPTCSHLRHRRRGIVSICRQGLISKFSSSTSDDISNDDPNNQVIRQTKYEQLQQATTLSLAPMMEYTDRHFRHLVRLVSSQTLLYTEMVAANAIAHERQRAVDDHQTQHGTTTANGQTIADYNDNYLQRFLRQADNEGPCVLQLGGSDPQQMYEAADTVMDIRQHGHCDYTALNLNCGCPSPKVAGKGCFGAALMQDAPLVAELTRALHEGCNGQLPVTVKCRIGTDTEEQPFSKQAIVDPEKEYETLCRFVETVASNGIVTDFSVHARIAVLSKSYSPADNRKIPPLKYDMVRRLVKDYPDLTFSLNGGIDSLPQAQAELEACPGLSGIMIGRAWAADPWSFAMTDHLLYNRPEPPETTNRLQILQAYGRHADAEEARGDPVRIRRFITKAVTPLFTGEPNAKRYRIALDEIAGLPKKLASQGKSIEGQPPLSELIINAAMEHLSEETLLKSPQESYYERVVQAKHRDASGVDRSPSVAAWQAHRKEQENRPEEFQNMNESTNISSARAGI